MTKDLINEMADLCNETSGASFAITRLKDRQWQVAFMNSQRLNNSKGFDIDTVLANAINEIKTKRVPIETETRFTVYL